MSEKVAILLPNYKTPELTTLCCRLLRKHTTPGLARVIAVDNDSGDESTGYLRNLKWLELIERPAVPGEPPAEMHARALDLAFERVREPLVMVMHTDTLVVRDGWLEFLIAELGEDCGIGSWKLEHESRWKRFWKRVEEVFKPNREFRYLRSHCALYRTDEVRRIGCGFWGGESAGRRLHRELAANGKKLRFLASAELEHYLRHLNHASMILNPEIAGKRTGTARARRRVAAELARLDYRAVLADNTLDR